MVLALGRMFAAYPAATSHWGELLGTRTRAAKAAGRNGLARAIVHAVRLNAMLRVMSPSLVATFDESGLWARVLPAVADRHHVPSLDLPHADTISAAAISGAAYTRMAVFGQRAALRLVEAGISRERIVETGAPRFDDLLQRLKSGSDTLGPGRRVLLASQSLIGENTRQVKAGVLAAAIRIAESVAPAEIVVIPHPLEADTVLHDELEHLRLPDGVRISFRPAGELYRELPGAFCLVTGWSSSVLEAAIALVPAVIADVSGQPHPMSYIEDGLALEAPDATAASEIGRRLLDEEDRSAVVMRAHVALVQFIGPLDGRASERAADLILELSIR
jgi:hypothetical protein